MEKSVKSSVSDSGHSCDSHSSNGGHGCKNSNQNKENSNGSLVNGDSSSGGGGGSGGNTRYFIGKESLKCWQSLALKRLEAQLPSFKFIEPASESLPNSQTAKAGIEEEVTELVEVPEMVVYYEESSTTAKETTEKAPQLDGQPSSNLVPVAPSSTITVFNEDITCPHNCLAPTPNKRLVNSTLWQQIFQHYFYSDDSSKFKTCPVFTEDAKECKLCLVSNNGDAVKILTSW